MLIDFADSPALDRARANEYWLQKYPPPAMRAKTCEPFGNEHALGELDQERVERKVDGPLRAQDVELYSKEGQQPSQGNDEARHAESVEHLTVEPANQSTCTERRQERENDRPAVEDEGGGQYCC